MSLKKQRIGNKNYIVHFSNGDEWESANDVLDSWITNQFKYPEGKSETKKGFRSAQLGAIFAIKSHWTVSNSTATVVMPTGTGKTEVMIATVVSEGCKKTCIIVPSNLLRQQTVERFCSLGKLREIGAIDESFKNPVVGCLVSTPKDISEFQTLLDKSNVIVTTISLLNSKYFQDEFIRMMVSACDRLFIDEAHHVPSNSWNQIKKAFAAARCLQFTATPFRNDGKKIDGDIIYNFPLSLAQEQGYFKPINFYPVFEFDRDQRDYSVAKKAVSLLEIDIANGFPHVLLVRAANQGRAIKLFEDVYKKHYAKHFPVLIISQNSVNENRKAIRSVNEGISKIVVCVDMFSEGIDIPQLKICAIHDKYKSLPITIQFVGRFARAQGDLGEASVVANVVDDDIQESLEELYSQDADWNIILKDKTNAKIGKELELQKLARGFNGTSVIPLNQIRPKISMFMYTTSATQWHWKEWTSVINEDSSNHYINEQEKILIITELYTSNVDWTTCRKITDSNWNLHIIYWNSEKNVFFINTTDKGIADRLAGAIFDSYERIHGENIFRCLFGIKRLMLSTVGLKTALPSHHIRYRMFAGVDIAEGISSATTGTSTKSNLFGVGYENGHAISIGCSYKGTIWAKWVETVDYWKAWCDEQANKVLSSDIDTTEILKGALIPETISRRPVTIPYRIDFPAEIAMDLSGAVTIQSPLFETSMFLVDIRLSDFDETSDLSFWVGNDTFKEEFTLNLTDKEYFFSHKSGTELSLQFRRKQRMSLVDYFQNNPPTIWFVDGSSLEGNLLVKLKADRPIKFPEDRIIHWDWSNVDISKESQGTDKAVDSIQYKLISELKTINKYCLIFDDDGPGEIADVIAVQEDPANYRLRFELFHCKYSGAQQAGARVGDLYEVCGQAEKSIRWASDAKSVVERLIKRESDRRNKYLSSRYEIGNDNVVYQLKNKLKIYSTEFHVYIVQPGVDGYNITPPMHQVLCSAEAYLKDTYAVPLSLICS